MKHKKLYLKLLIGFLILAGLLTYLSGRICYYMLPEVSVEDEKPGTITQSFNTTGTFDFKEKTKITAPAACSVEKVLVHTGNPVAVGTGLIQLSEYELKTAEYQESIQLKNLKAQQKSLASGSDELKLAKLQIETLQSNLNQIQTLLKQGCVIKSGETGTVADVAVQDGDKVEKDAVLLSTAEKDKNLQVLWTMDNASAQVFKENNPVSVSLSVLDSKNEVQSVTVKSKIAVSAKDTRKNNYLCSCNVSLSGDQTINMSEGDDVGVMMKSSGDECPYTVPVSSVTFGDSNQCTVYVVKERKKIYGTEHYVQKVNFTADSYDDLNVSSKVPIGFAEKCTVVACTSKPLTDGQAVRIADNTNLR